MLIYIRVVFEFIGYTGRVTTGSKPFIIFLILITGNQWVINLVFDALLLNKVELMKTGYNLYDNIFIYRSNSRNFII